MAQVIYWSAQAEKDLKNICIYIAQDSRTHAVKFAERIFRIVESIPQFPHLGRMVPEFQNPELRERILLPDE